MTAHPIFQLFQTTTIVVAVNPRCVLGGILIIIVNFITITLITKHAVCIHHSREFAFERLSFPF